MQKKGEKEQQTLKKSLSKLDSEDIKRRVRSSVDSLDHGSQVKSQSQIQLFTIWYVWLKSADMMTNDTAQSSTLSMRLPNLKLSHFLSDHLYWNNNCGIYSGYFLTKFCSMWLIIIPYISFRAHVKAHNTTDQHIFYISTQGHVRKTLIDH